MFFLLILIIVVNGGGDFYTTMVSYGQPCVGCPVSCLS